MCTYENEISEEKIVFMDIKGGSAIWHTRHKKRVTDSFNIYKKDLNNGLLYVLNLRTNGVVKYTIYSIVLPKEELKKVRTDLAGYDATICEKYKDDMQILMSGIDDLHIIFRNFQELEGDCDIVVKKIVAKEKVNVIEFMPLVTKKVDKVTGHEYYFEGTGDFRVVLEVAVEKGNVFEFPNSEQMRNIHDKK